MATFEHSIVLPNIDTASIWALVSASLGTWMSATLSWFGTRLEAKDGVVKEIGMAFLDTGMAACKSLHAS